MQGRFNHTGDQLVNKNFVYTENNPLFYRTSWGWEGGRIQQQIYSCRNPSPTLLIISFFQHFKEVFGPPAGDTSVAEQLHWIRQGERDISDYSLQFRTLAAASGWNEPAMITTYRQGLNPCLRLQHVSYDDTIGIERFIQLSIRMAHHMQSCFHEQPSLSPPLNSSGGYHGPPRAHS